MLDQSELARYLAKIERAFGISDLLQLRADKDSIVQYYSESEAGYRVFHNSEGAMHMTLATESSSTKDYLGQARIVEDHLRELSASAILELGCGKGFNLGYLARYHPEAKFAGIDLTPRHVLGASRKYSNLRNLAVDIGDFQTPPFGNGSFDIVFEVEALCHAQDAVVAFNEAYRILRPGGRFILFDGFRASDLSSYSQDLQLAVRLVELTMAVEAFPTLDHWLSIARTAGFDVVGSTDLSNATMPNLERFQVMARGFYKFPIITRHLMYWLPSALVKNAVAGLLLPFTVSAGAQRYYSVVLEKQRD